MSWIFSVCLVSGDWSCVDKGQSISVLYCTTVSLYYNQPEVWTWHLFWVGWRPGTTSEAVEDIRGSSSSSVSDSLIEVSGGSASSTLSALWSLPLHLSMVRQVPRSVLGDLVSSIEAIPESGHSRCWLPELTWGWGPGLGEEDWPLTSSLSWPEEDRLRVSSLATPGSSEKNFTLFGWIYYFNLECV